MTKGKIYSFQKRGSGYDVFDVAGRNLGHVCGDDDGWYARKSDSDDWEYGGRTRKGCVESCLARKKKKVVLIDRDDAGIVLVRSLVCRLTSFYERRDAATALGVKEWSDWDWDIALECLPPHVKSWYVALDSSPCNRAAGSLPSPGISPQPSLPSQTGTP